MIVVFGSLNMDVVVRTPRLPARGETLLGESCALQPGGKGANQAIAAARAGAGVAMFGAVGRDPFGDALRQNLRDQGVEASGVRVVEEMTGCATITIDSAGQNTICVAPGANTKADAGLVQEALLRAGNTIVMQMEVPPAQNWALLERAGRAGARTILNLAPATGVDETFAAAARRLLDVLVVNETEAATLLAHLGSARAPAEDAAGVLADAFDVAAVVTLGSAGAIAAEGGRLHRAPSLAVDVVDTTGAGDTFVGVLAAALDGGAPWAEALRRACVAGSLACTALGAQPAMPTRAELDAAIARLG